jgi:hypothetical protein
LADDALLERLQRRRTAQIEAAERRERALERIERAAREAEP